MKWWMKLALDAGVGAAVWAAGLWVFHAAGEWGSLEFLAWAPLCPAGIPWAFFRYGFCDLWWWWMVCLLRVVFAGQFAGRRGWGWTVAGAVAVALWFALGVAIALMGAGTAHC